MLRLRFLVKKFSRSFSIFEPQHSKEKTIIDMKFSSLSLDSFLKDVEISKTSLPMLTYILKITKDTPDMPIYTSRCKLFEIRDEVMNNLDKLDPHSIINFCEWITKSGLFGKEAYLSIEKKEILISRINEFLKNRSWNRAQILAIHESLTPRSIKIEDLDIEIDKITNTPLTLKEISQILTGCGKFIYTQNKFWFFICIDKFLNLKEKHDVKYLAKIFDALAIPTYSHVNDYLNNFAIAIEKTLPRWKENDLLSILKFYENHRNIYLGTFSRALEMVNSSLNNDQPIEFAIELVSLLKKDIGHNPIEDEIVSKSLKIITKKLQLGPISYKYKIKLIDAMNPTMDYEIAITLANQVSRCRQERFSEILQKASLISVNKEGKLFPFIDLISNKIELMEQDKINLLFNIILTKSNLYNLQRQKDLIIDYLKMWLPLDALNFEKLYHEAKNREYNSLLIKTLKPLQSTIFSLLKLQLDQEFSLLRSIYFYESDTEKWREFLIENKNNFSITAISNAIRYYKGPFEAIIFLLQTYKKKLAPNWIGIALQRIYEVQDSQVINDFARILNKIDPYYLLNDPMIFSQAESFNYIFNNSDASLLSELFAGACELLKDLPIDYIFRNQNIKIVSFASILGKLTPELAELIISNCDYMSIFDEWSMLIISSKCSDSKLREKMIKRVFNENLDLSNLSPLLYRYWYHPETKEIDDYIIDLLKKMVPAQDMDGIWFITLAINKLSGININKHLDLFNAMMALAKKMVLANADRLLFTHLTSLLSFAQNQLPIDFDIGDLIRKSQKMIKLQNREFRREKLIEKIKSVGLSSRDAVLSICNKEDNLRSAYLAETISCLAELRFEKAIWANKLANKLIDYAEDKYITFESDLEYINWIYGLVAFKANKSIIMRNIENSKYFECEVPTFKHFLLGNHFKMDPDYKGIRFLKQNTLQYMHDFDYFKHFGIDAPLISLIKSSLNKENLEVKAGTFLDGVWIPFYIPSTKAAIWPVTNSILLYRSKIARGEFAMHRTQMQQKLKDLIILNEDQTNKIEVGGIRQFFTI